MATTVVTAQNFENEVIFSEKPVLVDFWASWCGPCRMLSPVVDEIAEENSGAVKVGKVNVDEEPSLAQKFGVVSIPTLVLFKNGRVEATSVGVVPKETIVSMING